MEHTQQQTQGDMRRAEKLSLQASSPPVISGYQVLRPLGEGAFGHVWLAMDLNTRRPVAIKCYIQRGSLDLDSLSREVSLLANIATGRHIVQILKVGWDHEPPYYVMEYLENGSLEDWIRSSEEMTVAQSVALMRDIAEGLSFAHGKGVLHCDLKPANVLLDHLFQPRLADFGQGRMAGDQTASLGTLFYMAPEQADLKSLPDVTWDVYGLGAIAYTMLVGAPPFRTPDVLETLNTSNSLGDRLQKYQKAIQTAARPRMHYLRRGVDKPLAQIIDRCLHVNPQRRYQNVQQVIEALDHRQYARSRRPLYMLGLIGPLLLVSMMLAFSMRSRMVALDQSERSVVHRALESNQFAARYAARTLESEIQMLFRMVERETERADLRQLLLECSVAGQSALGAIAEGNTSPMLKEQVLALPERVKLESYLQQRIEWMVENRKDSDTLMNSVFVNDTYGTNLGIAFVDEEERETAVSPVGGNFAYRSYFSGQRLDAATSGPPRSIQPITLTRLSATFRSTSTGTWKIAISAPIWDEQYVNDQPVDPALNPRPIGVFVMTINLGDFELLSEQDPLDAGPARFAVLFDGRKGNQLGTLLQHPYMCDLDRETIKSIVIPQIPLGVIEALIDKGLDDYRDPVAEFEGGVAYSGPWLASSAQVELPRTGSDRSEDREKSDLWILVQERRNSVSAPIQSLSSRLRRESYLEIAALVAVIMAMWYFVFRLGPSKITPRRASGESPDSLSGATETKRL